MNQKQKMLLIGGGVIAAVVLYAGFSKAAAKTPAPGPLPQPKPGPTPPYNPGPPGPTQSTSALVDSPFGKFMPCSAGPAMAEPYNSQVLAGIDASYDIEALQGAASVYHSAGCETLATRAGDRAQALSSGGQLPGSGQQVVMANIPKYGAANSACDLGGVMVDGQRGADIEKWMMSQNDPALLSQVAVALRQAQPPCEVLAKKADAQASYLNGVLADIAAQNKKMTDDANAAAGADSGSGGGAVETVKGWFS